MYRAHKWNEKGFTLIEMMIVLFILSLIIIQVFRMMDFNYKIVGDEVRENEWRQELNILTTFIFEDLMYAKHVNVYAQGDYDVLYYQNRNGKDVSLKFGHDSGIYEIRDGKEVKIISGRKFDENYPAVREKDGMIVFNYYSEEINVLLDRAVKPRKEGSR